MRREGLTRRRVLKGAGAATLSLTSTRVMSAAPPASSITPDLIAAAKNRKIAGAVLDVFRQEPLPADHPFWTAEGIIVLPHIGGPHPQRDRFVARLFVENLGLFLEGKPLRSLVDRAAGY